MNIETKLNDTLYDLAQHFKQESRTGIVPVYDTYYHNGYYYVITGDSCFDDDIDMGIAEVESTGIYQRASQEGWAEAKRYNKVKEQDWSDKLKGTGLDYSVYAFKIIRKDPFENYKEEFHCELALNS